MGEQTPKDKITAIREAIGDLQCELYEILEPLLPEPSMFYKISGWECEKSPFGYCAYHEIEDPVHDYCIFCGYPEERK